MRVEDAGRSLDDADGAIESLNLVDLALGVCNNSHKLQLEILGV